MLDYIDISFKENFFYKYNEVLGVFELSPSPSKNTMFKLSEFCPYIF